jgi:hypothetical protein
MTQSSYPKVNFNDLLAEWIDSFATYKECDYSRREDGTYDWVDWCTHGGEDFDKFIRSRLSSTTTRENK